MKFTQAVSGVFFLALTGCGGSGGGSTAESTPAESPNTNGSTSGASANITDAINKAFPDKKLAACVYTQSSGDLLSKLPFGTTDHDSFIRKELWAISCSSTSSTTNTEFTDQVTSL